MCYYCESCGAYVGCHNNSKNPLGTMANRETREWRMKAHKSFDPIWKKGNHRDIEYGLTRKDRKALKNQSFRRKSAYERLRIDLESEFPIHIGASDIEQCKKIIESCVNCGFINKT